MSSEEKTTNVVQRYAQPIRVKVIRGARGQYRWEIEDAGDDASTVLYTINYVDDRLRGRYLPAQPNPTMPTAKGPSSEEDAHSRMESNLASVKRAGEKLCGGVNANGKDYQACCG